MSSRSKRHRRRPVAPNADRTPGPPAAAVAVAEAAPLVQLERSDVLAAFGVAVASALLFLSTFSTHVALGDAPESVSGVKTLGVLHAPGYPSYVALGSTFAKIVAVGGWAARVNAFSLVCASLMVGAIYLLARSFGASRLGAALGSFVLASSASFWFNADFAKHYAFSGLLVTLAALSVALWQSGGRSTWLVIGGALLGAAAGASWELALIMAVGLAVLVGFGARRVGFACLAGSVAAVVIIAVASYGFLVWRARQQPAVNWGDATDFHRLVNQVTQRDFRGQDVSASQRSLIAKIAIRVPAYIGIVVRDVGVGAAAVAVFGAVFAMRSLDRGRKLFLAVVAALNLVAVVFVAGIDHISGFLTGIVAGGYLLDLLVVVAVLVALGATPLVEQAEAIAVRGKTSRSYRSRAGAAADRYRSSFAIALFVIVLAPSILVHYHLADHRQPAFADLYAHRVFTELPPHAVLFVFQADLTFPLVYRQAVFGDRPDVSVIVTTSLQFDWYRQQVARTLHLRSPVHAGPTDRQVLSLIGALRPSRPVFIDTGMMVFYRSRIPVRLRGLVAEVVPRGASTSIDRDALAGELIRDDHSDGIAGHADARFPNGFVHFLYARAHIELAKLFAAAHQLEPARTELARAVDDFPDDSTTRLAFRFAGQQGEKPADVERVIEAL